MAKKQEIIFEKVDKVVDRIVREGLSYSDRVTMEMDIVCAAKETGMDLDLLLKFDKFNFVHDIAGIRNCINRKTAKIERGFLPRCAR